MLHRCLAILIASLTLIGAASSARSFSHSSSNRWPGRTFGRRFSNRLNHLGAVAGSFILGVYLFVSIRIFGRHSNEAFSSLRIQDYKQWLRLRIDASGLLTIYTIAMDRVPRRWRATQRGGEATFSAHDARASRPRLIDRVEVR